MARRRTPYPAPPPADPACASAGWPGVLVLALAGGAAAAYHDDLGSTLVRRTEPPAPLVAPVPGFTAAPAPTPRAVARTAPSPRPTERAVRRALGPALDDPHLADLRAVVAPLTGRPVLDDGHGVVDAGLDAQAAHRRGRARGARPRPHLRHPGGAPTGASGIVLVGGGDPFLASKRPTRAGPATTRACRRWPAVTAQTAARPRGVTQVRVWPTTPRCSPGPRVNPRWPKSTSPTTWSPRSRLSGPTRASTRTGPAGSPTLPRRRPTCSRRTSRHDGIHVEPERRRGAGAAAAPRSSPASPACPLADIVERVLQVSDNEGAEVLAHQVGLAVDGRRVVRRRRARRVRQTLHGLGVDLPAREIHDGSGLSRHDRLDAETLVAVLQLAASPDAPRAAVGGHRPAGRGVRRLARVPLRRHARPRLGPRQDRHPHRHQRPGRPRHRCPRTAARLRVRQQPRARTPRRSTPAPPSTTWQPPRRLPLLSRHRIASGTDNSALRAARRLLA